MSGFPELKTLVTVTCDCFNPPVKYSLSWWQLAHSRRLFQELKELSKPSVAYLGVPCATSVPLSAHHHYPSRHLSACRPFWASWLIFACYPQQCWIGWVGTRKPPFLPAEYLCQCTLTSLRSFPGYWFSSREKKKKGLYMWERKGKRKNDGVGGRDHCWLLQNNKKTPLFLEAFRVFKN